MLDYQASLPALSINDMDTLCQQYLTILYNDAEKQDRSALPKDKVFQTYGEILYPSVDKLMSAIQLTEHDVFVDLGSGMGKIVIQFFLKSAIKAAYGIELLPELHQHALNAAKSLQQNLPDFYKGRRKLTFLLGDILETSFTKATVALLNSTCFTQSLLNELGKIIENTPSIHTLLSLRPINTLQRLVFMKVIRIECSWDTALCYIYGSNV